MKNKLARVIMIFVMLFVTDVATTGTAKAFSNNGTSRLAELDQSVQIKIIKTRGLCSHRCELAYCQT